MKRVSRLLGVADQALSSIANVAMTVVAARALDRREFGAFAVCFAVYLIVLGLARALATEPLLARGERGAHDNFRGAVGAMFVLGVGASVTCVTAGIIAGGAVGQALVVLAAFLPLLLVQDGWRFAAFAIDHPSGAIRVDLAWLALQVVGTVFLVVASPDGAGAFVAVWAGAGSTAAIAGGVWARALPRMVAGVRWIGANFDLGGPFAVEFLAAGGVAYASLSVLGVVSDISAVGAVRAGQTILGPINVLYTGMILTLVPQGAHYARTSPASLRKAMVRASAVLAGTAAAWTCVAVALPTPIGRGLFGDTWSHARSVIVPLGLALCGGGVVAGAAAGLRATAAAWLSLKARMATVPFTLILSVLGATVADELGFSVGLAVATWLTAGLWWAAFTRALSGRPADPRSDEALGSAPAELPTAGTA